MNNKYSILVVDDETIVTKVITRKLSGILNNEYNVFSTNNPDNAMEIVKKENIDVIISDQMMPQMEGTELLASVKKENEDIVRILITGKQDSNIAIDAINKGAVHKYQQKPVNMKELVTIIKKELIEYEKRLEIKLKANTLDKIDELFN